MSAREGREGGRKGINISESRSLRRKLEEPDDNVTFVRWFPPPFPSYLKKASPAGERPRAPAVGEDRTKKAVKTNALPAALSTRSPSGDLKWTIPPPLFLPSHHLLSRTSPPPPPFERRFVPSAPNDGSRPWRRRSDSLGGGGGVVASNGGDSWGGGKKEREGGGREDAGPLVTSASHDTIGGREGKTANKTNLTKMAPFTPNFLRGLRPQGRTRASMYL